MTARRSSVRSSRVAGPDGVGQPRPALVEEHEAAEGREPLVVLRPGHFPDELDMRDEPRGEHEIDRSSADDLVGDADIAGMGVSRGWCHRNRRVTYDDGAGQLGVEDCRRRKATRIAVWAAEGLRCELPNLQLEDALHSCICTRVGVTEVREAALRWLERYLSEGSPRLEHFAAITASLPKRDPAPCSA